MSKRHRIDLTERIGEFREAARHLWNIHLRRDATWDQQQLFGRLCRDLFAVIALRGHDAPILPVDSEAAGPILAYQISMRGSGKLPLFVNRDQPAAGYWDHPVDWIAPEDNNEIHPICFFDFDVLGWRSFEYVRSRIARCPSHPEIEGRDALVRLDYVSIGYTVETD